MWKYTALKEGSLQFRIKAAIEKVIKRQIMMKDIYDFYSV